MVSLSAFAAMVAMALTASTASASIKYEWSVAGTGLAEGHTILATVFADPAAPTITIKSKVFGVKVQLTSSEITAKRIDIVSKFHVELLGSPLSLLKVSVSSPSHCAVPGNEVEIEGGGEIVEDVNNHKAVLRFEPSTGTVFAKIKFEGASCALAGDETNLGGSVIAEPEAVGSGVQLSWLFKPAGTKSINSAGKEQTNELTLSGSEEKVELTGSVNAELSTLQVWTAL